MVILTTVVTMVLRISPSRNGYGIQTGFNNGGFNNATQTPDAGLDGRYALEFDFSDASLNAGQNVNFDINFSDGGALKHTEKVFFHSKRRNMIQSHVRQTMVQ